MLDGSLVQGIGQKLSLLQGVGQKLITVSHKLRIENLILEKWDYFMLLCRINYIQIRYFSFLFKN